MTLKENLNLRNLTLEKHFMKLSFTKWNKLYIKSLREIFLYAIITIIKLFFTIIYKYVNNYSNIDISLNNSFKAIFVRKFVLLVLLLHRKSLTLTIVNFPYSKFANNHLKWLNFRLVFRINDEMILTNQSSHRKVLFSLFFFNWCNVVLVRLNVSIEFFLLFMRWLRYEKG